MCLSKYLNGIGTDQLYLVSILESKELNIY